MSKKCIVNFGNTWMWHPKGQNRLKKSLQDVGFDGDVFLFNEHTLKCPSHSSVPYAFKPYAMAEAKKRGYEVILWLDSSFWAIKPLKSLFDFIETNGHAFDNAGYDVSKWTSDAALKKQGLSREEAQKTDLFSGGMMGLNLNKEPSREFLIRWLNGANDGVSFIGAWLNVNHCVSSNDYVAGHRHDMSVGSIIAHKLGMKTTPVNHFFAYRGWYQKYKDHLTFETSKEICLLCEGM